MFEQSRNIPFWTFRHDFEVIISEISLERKKI